MLIPDCGVNLGSGAHSLGAYCGKLRFVNYGKLPFSVLMLFYPHLAVSIVEVLLQKLEYVGFVFRIRIASQMVAFCLKKIEAYITKCYKIRINPVAPPSQHVVFPLIPVPPLTRLILRLLFRPHFQLLIQMESEVHFQFRVKLLFENFVKEIQLRRCTATFQCVVFICNHQWDLVGQTMTWLGVKVKADNPILEFFLIDRLAQPIVLAAQVFSQLLGVSRSIIENVLIRPATVF